LNGEIAPLFEHHPDIDRLITFKKEEMKNWKTYLKKVRRIMHLGNYDLIVDTRATIKTLWFSFFSLSTPYRIGKKKTYNRFFHNYRLNTKIDDDEVGQTLRLLSPLEKNFEIQYDRTFKLYVTPEEKETFRQRMKSEGINFSKPVVVCAVATRLAYKMWDKERMIQVLSRIIEEYDAQLIFNFSGKEEETVALRIQEKMNHHPHIFTHIQANGLRELAALLSNADFFFGNEGGPRHISQALDIPSYAIYPPSIDKKKWLPNANERFQGLEPKDISEKAEDKRLSYAEKFDFISVTELWKKLNPMLNKYIGKNG
jgi:heptosyltransferase-2